VLAALLAWVPATHACPVPRTASAADVQRALRAGTDVWGDRLLREPGGPTLAAARRFLPPLRYANAHGGAPLTASGVYYLAFGVPDGPRGVELPSLHVADGSEVYSGTTAGPSLAVSVGAAAFGACRPHLADGWLPILETRDHAYAQESFATTIPGTHAAAAFVRVSGPGPIRFTLSASGLRRSGNRLVRGAALYAAFSAGGRFDGSSLTYAQGPAYVVWPLRPAHLPAVDASAAYAAARAADEAYWRRRVAAGAQIDVPERYVDNALRALLVQSLELTWRYSIGNAYQEFSFPESVDAAEVLAEYGFAPEARSILHTSYTRAPNPYPQWKMGERLLATGLVERLFPEDPLLAQATPTLAGYLAKLTRALGADGLLARERYSSDIPDAVYGLHAQAVVWQGLREVASAWQAAGQQGLAVRARSLAARLGAGVRRALRRSERRLPDGSLFVPVRLLDGEKPYAHAVESRGGSYWDLVAPYALASGLVDRAQEEGALRYLLNHGARLLGLVRAGAYALYGRSAPFPTSGTDEVYGLNVARFLALADEPDQLVLSLYGELAAALTPDTFVAGEAASVSPLGGRRERSMYLPPNAVAGDALLETLRQQLVQDDGTSLRLAYATPRAWLAPGKRIAVSDLPTSFGPVSYSLTSRAGAVHVTIDTSQLRRLHALHLRLRTPRATRTLNLSIRSGKLDFVIRMP